MWNRGRRARALLVIPLLILTAQSGPSDPCADHEGSRVYGPFTTLAAIEVGRPVALRPGAVLAEETLQFAYRLWRTRAAVRLPAPQPVHYPAGSPVVEMQLGSRSERGLCLPFRDTEFVRFYDCLVDENGDGRFETIERMTVRMQMHVLFPRRMATVGLPAPLALADDPAGDPRMRSHAHRRIQVDGLDGDTAQLVIRDAIHRWDREPRAPRGGTPAFDEVDGVPTYRVGSEEFAAAEPANADDSYHIRLESRADIALAPGILGYGGIRLRLARDGRGWTATPLDRAFPPWIARRCGSRALHIGEPG